MVAVTLQRQARSAKRLHAAAQQAPIAAVEAATNALRALVTHQERAAVVTWTLNMLAENDVSDVAGLVAALERPEVLADLRRRDPFGPARLRGLRAKNELLDAEGGTVSGRELADALGITRQAVDKRRLSGKLIGLDLGKRGYAYPAWQLGLEGMDAVLAELDGFDPWTQTLFMLSADDALEGDTPLAAMRRGELERVIIAARLFGEQTAG